MPKIKVALPTILFVLLSALSFGAPTAGAAERTACAQQLLNDYFDGRIDKTYPVHCYREAIKALPEDVAVYGNARETISRALANAISGFRAQGKKVTPNTKVPGAEARGETSAPEKKKKKNVFAWVADKIGPGNATSIPLPLLILAGVGLLLVAAAGASYTAKRLQARRAAEPAPQPATSPPSPRRK
jgi:hypothetical protein